MKIFYMGWVGNNNIGDDLMLDNFKKCMSIYNKEKEGVYPSYPNVDINEINNYDIIVLGGGSILQYDYIKVLYNALNSGKRVIVWGAGYDCLEKEFIERVEKSNVPPYLYTDEQEQMLNEIAERADFFGVRGPLTYKLLEKSFINMDKIKIIGDPGFLVEEEMRESSPINKLKDKKNIIAINYGESNNRIFGQDQEKLEEDVIYLCNKLISKGYSLYLYSMWENDLDSLIRLYNKILDTKDVALDLNLYNGGELVSILRKCKFSINLKLHANIISLVANTPFVCIGYRFKSYDFIKSINCEELIVSTDSKGFNEEVFNIIKYIESNYKNIKVKMDKEYKKYKEGLEEIFKNII